MSPPPGPGSTAGASEQSRRAPAKGASLPVTLGVVALHVALQLLAVLNPDVAFHDMEERFNPLQSLLLLDGHWSAMFASQYRHFCGGCTVDAVLGAAVFSVLPPTWMAWKLVPIAYSALALGVGHRLLARQLSPRAAGLFALLVLLPPRTWLQLSLIGWGNHYEAGALVFVAMVLLTDPRGGRWRALAAGAVLGLALWVGFSAAFAVAGLLGWLGWRRDSERLPVVVAGLSLAALAWGAQYSTAGLHPFARIYHDGEAVPRLSRVPVKLWSLLAPPQLAGLLGMPSGAGGVALGLGYLGSLTVAGWAVLRRGRRTARAALLLLAVWLVIYLLVRFSVHVPPWPEVPVVHAMRYAAPTYLLLFLLLAATADRWWSVGRRAQAVALLAVPLVSGGLARLETVQGRFPQWDALRLEAVEHGFSRGHFSGSLTAGEHASCGTARPRLAALHQYALGKQAVWELAQGGAASVGAGRSRVPVLTGLQPTTGASTFWLAGVGDGILLELSQHTDSDTDPGTVALLGDAYRALRSAARLTEPERRLALREVAWSRRTADLRWSEILEPPERRQLAELQAELADAPESVQWASWWALGRLYGARSVPVHTPVAEELPPELAPWAPGFVEGVGHALGESWGPVARVPVPRGLEPGDLAELRRGYREGLDLQWHQGASLPLPELVDPWPGLARGVPGAGWRYGLSAL